MRRDVDAERMSVDGANRPSVRDDENGAVRMLGRDPLDRPDDALTHRLVGLAVLPAGSAFLPAGEGIRKALGALVPREAAPGADIHLSKLGQPDDLESAWNGNRLRSLPGAPQVAGVD